MFSCVCVLPAPKKTIGLQSLLSIIENQGFSRMWVAYVCMSPTPFQAKHVARFLLSLARPSVVVRSREERGRRGRTVDSR